jgi:xanthine dehydrogenase molybdenum-binding subunit
MKDFKVVGKRLPKLDAPEKASGKARYICDIVLPGMLYGKIKRSPIPHGKILNIDTSKAERLPGIKAVVTYKDTPMRKFGFAKDNLPLKKDKVCRIGDEVAAVAGIDENIAQEALDLIKVDYKELPALFDAEKALEPGAPVIHEDKGTNLYVSQHYTHGDIKKGVQESYATALGNFQTPYQAHCCMGTSGIIAEWDFQGRLTVYDPTQIPFICQRDLSDALGMNGSNIRIIQPVIGGGFGMRLDTYAYEIIAAILARKSGKPIKIIFDREEEFIMDPFRPLTKIFIRSGVTRDGFLTFREIKTLIDGGAYVSWGTATPIVAMHTAPCLYRIPHVDYKATVVYTNNPHVGAMRGFGNPEVTFAIESQIDQLAEKIGMDPVKMRLLNVNKAGDITPQGSRITSCGFGECISKVAEVIGWEEKKNNTNWRTPNSTIRRGIGIAGMIHVGGGARIYRSDGCGAIVKIDDFGKVTVITGATDIGQGAETAMAQIAAEELGVPIESVSVSYPDTDIKPWDVGVHASRTTFIAGNATRLAARDAKNQLLEVASLMLSEDIKSIAISDGIAYSTKNPQNKIELGKVVRSLHFRQDGNIIIGTHFYDPPNVMVDRDHKGNISATYSFGAQAVEVEIDIETGKINVIRVVAAHDVGKAINPMYLEGQIEGGVMMGLGYALTEEVIVKDGKVLNPNFLDYKVPGSQDCPEIIPILVETDDPDGPFGAKGVGEPGCVPTPAAVANAVANALDTRIYTLPIAPERILKTLKDLSSKGINPD